MGGATMSEETLRTIAINRAAMMTPAQRRRFIWLVRRAAMHPARASWLLSAFGPEVDGAGRGDVGELKTLR